MGYGAARGRQQPVFVVTRNPPDKARLGDRFTFVVDGLRQRRRQGRSRWPRTGMW